MARSCPIPLPAGDAQRPLLVALHGWLLAGRLWHPLADRLKPGWELWAPDLPGFGQASRPRGLQPNLVSYGRWVAEQARQRAGDRPLVLIGHSLGGSLALQAAPLLDGQLQGLVQIASGGGVYQPRPFRAVRRGGASFLRWRPRWLLALPGSEAIASPLRAELRAARGLLASSMRRSSVQQLPQLASQLTVPSLWVAGSHDQVMEPRYVRHLASYCPRHRVEVLEGCGHLPMRQQPRQLASVLSHWLEQLQLQQLG